MISRMYFRRKIVVLLIALAMLVVGHVTCQLIEEERLVEYYKRNYSWPITQFVPNTPGWNKLMSKRLYQIEQMDKTEERYSGFVQTLHSAVLAPNYTEYGFGLARCPDELLASLQQGIRDGIENASEEEKTDEIISPQLPLLVNRPDLVNRVLYELQPYAEQWSNQTLQPWGAYGFRLYRNESKLYMHIDRMQTHVISFILHIDSSDDAQPWPIFIEDFNGVTHEVILTPGDILFYESSKCFHGRPHKFNGSWYSSIFVHYTPIEWKDNNHELEADYAVPPFWSDDTRDEQQQQQQQQHVEKNDDDTDIIPYLVMAGAGMKEPDCPDEWCNVQNSKKWSGPGEKGVWITPNFERRPLPVSGTDVTVVTDK
jgi:hypothetical protein